MLMIELEGPWKKGYAYDLHTVESVYLGVDAYGHDQWDTTRSEMGELVYQLKYRGDKSMTAKIVDSLVAKVDGFHKFDWIVPIPATNEQRSVQPVIEVSRELSKRTGVSVIEDLLQKQGGDELKSVDDPDERERILMETLEISPRQSIRGKNILLLDDLYRSGATLSAATRLLYERRAGNVSVLAMTKTRSKR